MRHNIIVGLCATVILICAAGSRAQVTTGTILGTVSDSTGGVVPGAAVVVANVGTGVTRRVPTDDTGRYSVPQLPIGSYEVAVTLEGFQSVIRSGIELTVGREVVVSFNLEVGTVAEAVTVTAEAPLIETTSSSVTGLVSQAQMRDLPLNARSYEQFAFLQPTVFYQRNETSATNTGFAPKISAGGMRTAFNTFLEDGIDINDTTGQTPGSAAGQLMGVETLQEFRVLTNNYSAAYGNALGAVIEVASKGGTNALHGSLFEFLRNSSLDARNFFDGEKPAFRRNQFGGTVGGPIVQDRAFFFGSYEALRERLTTNDTVFVPTAAAHLGILPDPSDPSQTITIPVAPEIRPYLDLYPFPQEDLGAGIGSYRFPFSGKTRTDFFSGRVDYRFSDNVSYFGRYRVDDTDLTHRKCAVCIDPWAEGLASRNHLLTLGETRILSPEIINDFRLGFVRYTPETSLALTGTDPMIQFPNVLGAGIIAFTTGFGSGGQGIASLGTPGRPFEQQHGNTFEVLDNLSYVRGAHTFKAGFNLERFQDNVGNRTEEGLYADTATYTFESLQDLLVGRARSFGGAVIQSPTAISGRAWMLGMYLQDDFRLLPNFTLNLGVRYEFVTPYSSVHSRFILLHDLFGEPLTGQKENSTGRTCAGCVDPRVGFAWDVFSNAKSVVKMGFGVFRSQLIHYNAYHQTPRGTPGGVDLSVDNPSFPDPTIANATSRIRFTETGTGAGGVNARPALPSVPSALQWNLTIDQQLSSDTTVRLAYLGSHGYHLDAGYPLNQNTHEVLPDGSFYFAPGLHRIRPDFNAINYVGYDFNSFYNGFTATLAKRMRGGLAFETSYAFSRTTDDTSLEQSSRTHLVAELRPPDGRRDTYHGLSGLDMRHRFVTNVTYELPSFAAGSGFAAKLLSGWQLNSIISLQAGTPITPWIGFDRANTRSSGATETQRPDLAPGFSGKVPICPCPIPDSLGGGIQEAPQRYFDPTVMVLPAAGTYGNMGRNIIIGPGLANMDFGVVKNTLLTERINMQFRAEGFNILNGVNWAQPSVNMFQSNGAYSGNAGAITATSTTGRQFQFALKLVF